MAVSKDYLQYVLEQLAGLGHVSSRRMFSGVGLYCGELFFGLIFRDTLYFKVGDSNRADYQNRGMGQFRPRADKPRLSMNYYEVPVEILEDGEHLVAWARKSITVSAVAKARPRTRRTNL
jgi:DNA transformation protein and related proteins